MIQFILYNDFNYKCKYYTDGLLNFTTYTKCNIKKLCYGQNGNPKLHE